MSDIVKATKEHEAEAYLPGRKAYEFFQELDEKCHHKEIAMDVAMDGLEEEVLWHTQID